jgi:hypothetical protein
MTIGLFSRGLAKSWGEAKEIILKEWKNKNEGKFGNQTDI